MTGTRRFNSHGRHFLTGLVLSALLAGSSFAERPCSIDKCLTHARGAPPAPNGYYVRAWQNAITFEAAADQLVIYHHEWCPGGWTLSSYGLYHLHEIARWLPHVPFPVVIQPGAHAELNELRREVIVKQLLQLGVVDAAARAVIRFPQARGLSGDEAERVDQRSLRGPAGVGIRGGSVASYAGSGGALGISPR